MRKLIFLIIACLIVVFEVYGSNFQPLNSGTTNNLSDVWFTDANTGYVCGIYGTLLKTTNAGQTWFNLNSGTTESLLNIHFINSLTGYLVGGNGIFLKTTNAGVNWLSSYPAYNSLWGVYFINNQTGWITGIASTCKKTTDGGTTWLNQVLPIGSASLNKVVFNNGKGFISVRNSVTNLLTTTDEGANWVDSKIRTGLLSTSDFCFSNNFGMAAGFESINNYAHPSIFITTNNGQTWFEPTLPNRKGSINSVSHCGNYCYAVGVYWNDSIYNNKGLILVSSNSGANWAEEPWLDGVDLTGVFTTVTDAYIVGYEGLILKSPHSVGITPIGSVVPKDYSLSQNYPNPFNPVTNIKFSLPKSGAVKLAVYDLTGKEVEVLVNQSLSAGDYKVDFTANKLASGIYFYRLQAGNFIETKKMILVR